METPLSLPDGNIVFPDTAIPPYTITTKDLPYCEPLGVEISDICQQQRKRLGLGPTPDQSLTQNPGHDVQSAAFDGSVPPRINLAPYSHTQR